MGLLVETLEIYFTPHELRWLEKQAEHKSDSIQSFIRDRALNTGSKIPDEESYQRFHSDWQCTCGVCCID